MPAAKKPRASSASAAPGVLRTVLLLGADARRKTEEAHRLADEHTDPDFSDFDRETIEGDGASAERILGATGTVPLGERRRVVVLRDPQQMEPEEQKRLAAGLDALPASAFLILLTGTPLIEEGKTRRGTTVVAELTSATRKCGEVREFGVPRAEDLRGRLVARARAAGKTLAPEALALLTQLPSEDALRADTELEKAMLHAGAAERVALEDVEATLSRTPDDVIFKLCDAVGSRRRAEALGHVATLFRSGGRPESIAPRALVMLARQIRLLAQFRFLASQRSGGRGSDGAPEAMALLPSDGAAAILANPRTAWMADKYIAQARQFSAGELTERLEWLLEADQKLKGTLPGGDTPQLTLQQLVARLCG